MPTSRAITTTIRTSAAVDSCQANCGIFEDRLDGRVEGVLSVNLFVVVGDMLMLVKFFDGMTVE